jgi:natural product precursor
MKKLGKLKLNQISQMDLNEREMCRLLGGGTSGCC